MGGGGVGGLEVETRKRRKEDRRSGQFKKNRIRFTKDKEKGCCGYTIVTLTSRALVKNNV